MFIPKQRINTWINIRNNQKTKSKLAKVLAYLSKSNFYIITCNFVRQKHSYIQYCDIEFEINKSKIEEVRKIVERKVKVIEFYSKKDAYNK